MIAQSSSSPSPFVQATGRLAVLERTSPSRTALVVCAVALWLVALWLVGGAAAEATVFTRLDDRQLMEQAEGIVEGEVVGLSAPLDGEVPAVDYRVRVEHWIKGAAAADEITVRVPGGVRPDGVGLLLFGAPRLPVGERVLLFLSTRGDGAFGLTQFMLGAFHVVPGVDGRFLALRDVGGARELTLPGETPFEGPRDLVRFRQWLRASAAGRSPVVDYFLTEEPPLQRFSTILSSTEPAPLGCGDHGGHPVRWFDFDRGAQVPWRAYFRGQPGLEDNGLPALEEALAAWNDDPGTGLDLTFAGITAKRNGLRRPDETNTVLFDDPGDEIGGSWRIGGVLALGGPWFDCRLRTLDGEMYHPIFEADIVTQNGLDRFFATLDPASTGAELFAHELGHTLGLDHSTDREALMFAEIHADGRGAVLAEDDRAGIHALYGPPPDLDPPTAPANLEAMARSSRRVALSWIDLSTTEDGFRIERRAAGEFKVVAAVEGPASRFVDTQVAAEIAYTYRVRAQNRAGGSPWSNEVTVTTPPENLPAAPTNLRAAALDAERIRLTWQDNADNEDEYFIFLFSQVSSTWVEIPVPLPADTRSANLVGLTPGRFYGIQVRARNSQGDSEPSNDVSSRTFDANPPCTTTADTLCLLGGRFRVEVSFRNQHAPGTPARGARALPSTDQIGNFWFFEPDNIELVVKMVDGRSLNGHFWIYYGGITDLEVWLTITDMETGVEQIYYKEPGEVCGAADILAFGAPPDAGGAEVVAVVAATVEDDVPEPANRDVERGNQGTCEVDATTLCLLDDRLSVRLNWWRLRQAGAPVGDARQGQAINDGGDSGAFWFFNSQNTEVVFKAIDGRNLNGYLWIFFGTLSNLEYELIVTDTLTGDQQTYYNPPGSLCGQADVQAFQVTAPP